MRRVHVPSATGICTFFVLLMILKFQAFLRYETTYAFSPSLSFPTSLVHKNSVLCKTKKHLEPSSRLQLVTEGTSPGAQNHTSESESQLPIRYDRSRIRFRCRLAYDGTSFGGFQLQGGRSKAKKEEPSDGSSQSSVLTKEQRKQKRKKDRIDKKNNPRTIQGELETVLSRRFQRLVTVTGAGRTDGGVHARGQAMHFDLYRNETSAAKSNANAKADGSVSSTFDSDLETTMNRMLPSDIRVWNLGRASPDPVADTGSNHTPPGWYNWNAIRSCTSKLYSYRICTGDVMDPTERHHRWQLPWRGVDPRRLEEILLNFEGEHDFACFAGALEQYEKKMGFAMGTVRTIHKIKLVQEARVHHNNGDESHGDESKDDMGGDTSQHYYRIDIYLDGALYKMVRNMVGTAIDVSRGELDEETFLDLLNRPPGLNYTRKNNPCRPAPPNGLTLESVFYPEEMEF